MKRLIPHFSLLILLSAVGARAELPIDLFEVAPPPAGRPDSRDMKGWDAKRQQDDAERIQNSQAMAKMVVKQGKEIERMTTIDPGRKAQLTQEIERLQYEINKHLEQGQALKETAEKAEYAAKQAEAGNAKKGSQVQTSKLDSVSPEEQAKLDEEAAAAAATKSADDAARGDVANVLPENAAASADQAFAARGSADGKEATNQVGFNDEVSELDEPAKSSEEIVSSAKAAFEQRLDQLNIAPVSASAAPASSLDKDIELSEENKEAFEAADALRKNQESKLPGPMASAGPGGGSNSLLELLRDRVASASSDLAALQASFSVPGLPTLPGFSDGLNGAPTARRGLASVDDEMPLTQLPPVNGLARLIAGSNRVQRNRIPVAAADPL